MELTELMRRRFAFNRFAPTFEMPDDVLGILSRNMIVNVLVKQCTYASRFEIEDYLNAEAYIIPLKGIVK